MNRTLAAHFMRGLAVAGACGRLRGMSERYTKELLRFNATDHAGHEHVVIQYQDYTILKTQAGEEHLPTLKSFKTADGRNVSWRGKGRYEIAPVRIELTSDDPAAP